MSGLPGVFRALRPKDKILQAISVVCGAAALHQFVTSIGAEVAKPGSVLTLAAIFLALAVIAYVLNDIHQTVQDLSQQQLFRLDYYSCNTEQDAVVAYKKLKLLFQGLPDNSTKVSVLNQFAETFEAQGERAEKSRKEYLDTILAKVNHINYHRIVQVRAQEIDSNWANRLATSYLEHLLKILTKLEQNRDARGITSLEIMPSLYPLSFMTVTTGTAENYFLWQIEEHQPFEGTEKNKYKVAGYLVITDPQQLIVEKFAALFNRAASSANRRPVNREELKKAMNANGDRQSLSAKV